jgi:flagellar biosynthesis protein FlhF
MKIKRFVAATMRQALAQVREEQGPDAVILSNRRIDGGIELITAVDYDETLIEEALKRTRPEPAPAAVPEPVAPPAPAATTPARRPSTAERARALLERATASATRTREPVAPSVPAAATAAAVAAAAMMDADRAPRAASPARRAAAPEIDLGFDEIEDDVIDVAPMRATPPARREAPPAAREATPSKAPPAPAVRVESPPRPDAPATSRRESAPPAPMPVRDLAATPERDETDARPRIVWSQDPEVIAMRREVEGLRQLLQDQLSSLAWSDRLRREPVRAGVLRDLSRLGLAPDVARALAERVPTDATAGESFRLPLALLMKHVPTVDDRLLSAGGTFAVVGPTGVGKTTTIAKLAARFALAHGAHRVALVSLDHYRIGARDQLLTFARILGVPMHVATNARELGAVLKQLGDRKLVLIDTAGMSPRDERLGAQFATLAAPGSPRPIRTLLTLAANGDHLALDEIARSYAPVKPEAVLLTKLDEAASFGPALSVALRRALPLAHLCDGQRVPQDLHAAPAKRVWLVKKAVKLARGAEARTGIDERYLAMHFGKVARHG